MNDEPGAPQQQQPGFYPNTTGYERIEAPNSYIFCPFISFWKEYLDYPYINWTAGIVTGFIITFLMVLISMNSVAENPRGVVSAFFVSMTICLVGSIVFPMLSCMIPKDPDWICKGLIPIFVALWWSWLFVSLAGGYRAAYKFQVGITSHVTTNAPIEGFDTSVMYQPFANRPEVKWGSFEVNIPVEVAYASSLIITDYDDTYTSWCIAPVVEAQYVNNLGFLDVPDNVTLTPSFWAVGYYCSIETAYRKWSTIKTHLPNGEIYTLSDTKIPAYMSSTYGPQSWDLRRIHDLPRQMNTNLEHGGVSNVRMPDDYVMVDWVADLEQAKHKNKKTTHTFIWLAYFWPLIFSPIFVLIETDCLGCCLP